MVGIRHHRRMSKKPRGMIGLLPSARGGRPADPGLHTSQIVQEWEDVRESYVRRGNRELGIPEHMNGEPDYAGDGKWRAFDPRGRKGGTNTTGVVVDSGVLNPERLRGEEGGSHLAEDAAEGPHRRDHRP
jgi:hypothetical protein